jgi:DNA-directed RNA polymerase subunit RPC12/RpoP
MTYKCRTCGKVLPPPTSKDTYITKSLDDTETVPVIIQCPSCGEDNFFRVRKEDVQE